MVVAGQRSGRSSHSASSSKGRKFRFRPSITDRNVILVKGQVVFEGSSAELHAKPELLAQYLGV
jgi:branched-chain amino acid transport system ATP-binding protein